MIKSPFLKISIFSGALAVTAILLAVAQPARSVAVEFIEIIEKHVPEQNQNMNGFRIENFDQWVFSNQQKIGGARKRLLDRLQAEAESIQSTCKLADQQKEKLLLAGRGDIQTFTQQYNTVRAKFAEKLKQNDQQAFQNIWQEIQPLQRKYHGQIYGEGSLFRKVLDHLLDEQQLARIEQLRKEQRVFQYRSMVMQLISQFDQASPLTHEKREKLLALIDEYTFPPQSTASTQQSHFVMYYVLSQMAEIPEGELRPLFGKATWKVLKQQIRQGKAMKRNLEQQGLVPEKG